MKSRRKFIKQSGAAVSALTFSKYVDMIPKFLKDKQSEIVILNTNWGFPGSLEDFISKSKEQGYDGVEVWVPSKKEDRLQLLQLIKDYDMKLGLLAGNNKGTPEENLQDFQFNLGNAIECNPIFINCHAGRDYFSMKDNGKFIEHTIKESSSSGIPIYHETHRGRILYNLPLAIDYMKEYPELEITLDISHWTVVHESLLENQAENVAIALSRTRHIHSRVGFQEAPQIPDPSDSQFKHAVNTHFAWWDTVVKNMTEQEKTLTMTTEFGPPYYMWTYPESAKPLKDNWDMNIIMKDLWKKRYL